MSEVTIYHNPRCSKSRQTMALLEDRGISPTVIHYLDTPPDAETLKQLLNGLGLAPRELMRRQESAYTELDLADPDMTDEELIAAMRENPILIERPIVVNGQRCAIGRPPENVLDIL